MYKKTAPEHCARESTTQKSESRLFVIFVCTMFWPLICEYCRKSKKTAPEHCARESTIHKSANIFFDIKSQEFPRILTNVFVDILLVVAFDLFTAKLIISPKNYGMKHIPVYMGNYGQYDITCVPAGVYLISAEHMHDI